MRPLLKGPLHKGSAKTGIFHVKFFSFTGISSQVKLNLSLDIVFFVSKETLLTSLPDLFTSAMSNQLGRMGSVIKEFSKVIRFSLM